MVGKRIYGSYELQDENQWRNAVTEGIDIVLSRAVPESESQSIRLEIEWPKAMSYPWSGEIVVDGVSWDGVATRIASGHSSSHLIDPTGSILRIWSIAAIGGAIPIQGEQMRMFRLFLPARPEADEVTVQLVHFPVAAPEGATAPNARLLPSVLASKTISRDWLFLVQCFQACQG